MRVIIIGAGFAGLAAANVLSGKCDVVILEGANVIGGRSRTVILSDGNVFELGCTFLHGSKASPLYEIASQLKVLGKENCARTVNLTSGGTKLSEDTVNRYREVFYDVQDETVREGRVKSIAPPPSESKSSRGLDLSTYLSAKFLEASSSVEDEDDIRQIVLQYLLCEEALDNGSKMSEGVDLLSYGDYDLPENLDACSIPIVGGYSKIVSTVARNVPSDSIHLNTEVVKVKWSLTPPHSDCKGYPSVQVLCADGRLYEADHVIITVSLGVLQSKGLSFEPQLPDWKQAAIDSLAIGVVDKVILQFDKPLVDEEHEAIAFFWREEDKNHPTVKPWAASQSKIDRVTNSSIYTAWFCGEDADIIETLPDNELVEGITSVLELFLKKFVKKPVLIGRSSWGKERLFQGSYSFNTPGTDKETRIALSKPIDGVLPLELLFAGEATHPSLFSTTHGAYESGRREANRLLAHHVGNGKMAT